MNTSPPQGARSALRAIRLLKLFTAERAEMSLVEMSRQAGLNKTTTHRLLQALQSEHLVQKNPVTNLYSLGTGLMALGVQALGSSRLRQRIRPVLQAIARISGETATLEVPVGDSMLILDEVVGTGSAAAGHVGTKWPQHATSTGKAYLAFDHHGLARLSKPLQALTPKTIVERDIFRSQFIDIRRRGYAVCVDELEDGYAAVATVFRGGFGNVLGTLSIGGPTPRLHVARRAQLGAMLCRAAQHIKPAECPV